MTGKPGGTREQMALGDWLERAELIRQHASNAAREIPSVTAYFDHLVGAGGAFGVCELHARSLDRSAIMRLYTERRKWLAAEVEKHNKAGLAQIGFARKALKQMATELGALELDRKWINKRLDEGVHELRLGIADWDMKGSDARKLDAMIAEVANQVRRHGVASLPKYLDSKMAQLDRVRRRKDRGSVDNIPFWKIIFLAGMVGWWLLGLFVCGIFGCSPATAAAFTWIGASHWFAFLLFC
jgi:hypothetical protein